MGDKEKIILMAMQKMLQQVKDMQDTIETMSESINLLVEIETNKLQKGE